MTRVATANSYSTVLSDLMRAQSRQQQAQTQVSSGRTASDLRGFARNAETLLAARSVQTRIDGFLEQGQALSNRLVAQDLALTQTADAAQGARQAIVDALAAGRGDSLGGQMASWFGSAVESLNAQHAGQYLFSGGQIDIKPVTVTQLSDLTGAPDLSDAFANDSLATISRLDENSTIKSGFLADEVGKPLFDSFRQVQAYIEANGPFGGVLTAAQTTFLEGIVGQFESAREGLTQVAQSNGLNQNRLEASMDQQKDRQMILKGTVSDVVDVNMAEAITRLEQAQTATQATAQVFTMLKDSSLLNLLR